MLISVFVGLSGANPTIVSYSAGTVKTKLFSSILKKCSSLLQRWRSSCKFRRRRIDSRSESLQDEKAYVVFLSKYFARIEKNTLWTATQTVF
jgi:hypothetical protein